MRQFEDIRYEAGAVMEHAEFVALVPFPSRVPAPGRRTGRAAWEGVAASLLLHLVVGAAAIGAISTAPSVPPPVIDLTLAGPGREAPATSAFTAAEPAKDPGAVPVPVPVPVPESPAPPVAPPVTPPVAARSDGIPPSNLSDLTARGNAPGDGIAGSFPAASPPSVVPGARAGIAEGGGPAGTGSPSGKTGAVRASGDFAGIRDGIQRRIAYPAMARRMGWEGKVVVAFLLLPDGSVRDIRVVQGSGHPVLDRGAVDAVRNASPFPRPSVKAEIVTPVVYRLSAAP